MTIDTILNLNKKRSYMGSPIFWMQHSNVVFGTPVFPFRQQKIYGFTNLSPDIFLHDSIVYKNV